MSENNNLHAEDIGPCAIPHSIFGRKAKVFLRSVSFNLQSLFSALIVLTFAGYFFAQAGIGSAYILFGVGHRIVIPIMVLYLMFLHTRGKSLLFGGELKYFGILVLVLLAISGVCLFQTGHLSANLAEGIFYLAWPFLLAYCVMNLFSARQIRNLMVCVLVVTFAAYLIQLRSKGLLSLSGFSTLSVEGSYSPYESSSFSGLSFALAAFFCYFNKGFWMRLLQITSILFCFLTFKRVFLLFLPVLLAIGLVRSLAERKPKAYTWAIMAIMTTIASICYFYFLLPGNASELERFLKDLFNVSVYEFTMGRDTQLYTLLSLGFQSYGYMSTLSWMPSYVEMEYCRIYLETGLIGVLSFSLYFWAVSRNSLYSLLYMLALTLNLILSWSLSSFLGWFLSYVVLFGSQMYNQKFELNEQLEQEVKDDAII